MKSKGFAILGLWLFTLGLAFATDAPKLMIEKASTRIFDELKKDRIQQKGGKQALFQLVGEVVLPHFDFAKMSRLVIKRKYWRKASADSQQAFVLAFRDHLVRTYTTALVQFDIEKIVYLPAKQRKGKNEVTVQTRVHLARTKPLAIDYRLYLNKQGEWKVFDIKIDGISLIISNRYGYNKIIKQSGIPSLTKILSTNKYAPLVLTHTG